MILPLEYKSKKKKKISEKLVREKIFNKSNNNLDYLLNKRFNWMKKYLSGHKRKVIFELGSGSGCIKKILKNEKIILTDVIKFKWINKKINMLRMNLSSTYKKKVDIFIFNHSLHHCPNPAKCLKLINKYLKKGGLVLINEPETSFSLKLIQMITRDEAWSYRKDIFDITKNLFKANDPWFSNTATAELLFKDEKKFKKKIS